MKQNLVKLFGASFEFESFGKNSLAYVRRVSQSDLNEYLSDFDEWDESSENMNSMTAGKGLWGLFGADGEPLAFSDEKAFLTKNAEELDLLTLRVQ